MLLRVVSFSRTRQATRLCLLATAFLSGCSEQPEIAPLSGKVSYRGKPLPTGSIMLQPAQGGKFSRADIQPDGTFVLKTVEGEEGATIGWNRVRVTCFPNKRITGGSSDSGGVVLGKSLIPEYYNNFSSSELTVEVLPEDNPPYVIELTN